MQLLKLFLSMSLLLFAFTLSGCQGNNSDAPVENTPPVVPPAENNDTVPSSLTFVNSNEINVTSSGEEVSIILIARNQYNTTDTEGTVSVTYEAGAQRTGLVTNSPATIKNGTVTFTYKAPADLKGAVDSGVTSSTITFFSVSNPKASATLKINYSPGSDIVIGEPVLSQLTLSDQNITITESQQAKKITLFAFTDQSTTDINLEVGIQYGNTGIDVGSFSPASPSIVNGQVTFTYNGPLNLSQTAGKLSSTKFVLYDKSHPGITAPFTVNFTPNAPVMRVENQTLALTKDAQSETVTVLAFDSKTRKAFESGTVVVQYPSDITDGTVSGGTFTQNEATIVNGKATFNFNGPAILRTIADQNFTFMYKENDTITANMTIQYSPALPQIASLAINEVNTTISQDKQQHIVTINALDANGKFVTSGNINVKFPSNVSNGTDMGSFAELSVPVLNGQAKFTYSGPESVQTTSGIVGSTTPVSFVFSDAAGRAADINWNVKYDPEVPTIRLTNANITLTKDAQKVNVQVLAFDENNQSLSDGVISVTYPNEIINQNANGGRFLENEVSISNGVALFTFEGPDTLENIGDLVFKFTYKGNTLVTPKDLTISYTPPTATIILNQTTKEVTQNSETINIDVDVRDSANNPFPTGNVKIIYPDDVKSGRDIGSFISSDVPLVNGIASFVYTAPKNLDANTSDIVFKFYHDSLVTSTVAYTVTLNPAPNQKILTDYFLTNSYADGNITMNLNSTKLITFYIKDKDGNLLNDSNITSITVDVLNKSLADLADTNASSTPGDTKTLDKNSASLSVISNTVSGVVPLRVVANFKGVNDENVTITEVFNVVIASGPPSAMSISYVSSSNDNANAKFVDKMMVALTDKYSNRVDSKPGLSVSLIAGYTADSSGPLGYMYHKTGGTIDTTDDKFKVATGSVTQINLTNGGSNYSTAPSVTLAGGDGNFSATAYLSNYGGISEVNIINPGKEYVTAPTVTVQGTGSGFVGTAVLSTTGTFFTKDVSTTTGQPIITLDNPGQGYTSAPDVNASGGDDNFDATAVLEATGSLRSLVINNGGANYKAGDGLVVGGDGSGATVNVKKVDASGAILSLNILSSGSGYTNIIIDTTGNGDGNADINATVGYSVKEIQLKNGGTGYSDDTISISGGSATVDAQASATIGYGIASVSVDSVGSGYRPGATIEFIPNTNSSGVNAAASTLVRYPVSYIEITNGGSGYSNGILTLSSPVNGGTTAAANAEVFAGFSTVVDSDDILMTFGDAYTFNASGKWDIVYNSGDSNYTLGLVDQFEGNTTSNLGFAMGNNFRQDRCLNAQEWVATAVAPSATFDSNGLAEIDINYDYYLAAKDVILSVNLVGAQNDINKTVKLGEAIKHTLRGTGLVADTLNLPAGLDHAIYRIYIELDGAPDTFRNSNFTYTVSTTSLGLTIHSIHDSMDDGIQNCPGNNDSGRAYVELEVSTTLSSTITLDNLVISREFK